MCGVSNSICHIFGTCNQSARIWCNWRLLWFYGTHANVQFEGKTKIWGIQTGKLRLHTVDRHPALWNSTSVAIKQCFYTSPSTGTRVLYDKHSQLTKLTAELNCLRWESALMGIVYNFINEHETNTGHSPSFLIPKMDFVKSVLAISETDQEVFLLEEVINEEVEGPFIKYIGNGSVTPYNFLKGDEHRQGEFLSFCQHVQFLKTKGLAFFSNFQGKHKHMKVIIS